MIKMGEVNKDNGDLVPPRNQSIKGVCFDCVEAGRPPDQTRLCETCLRCGDIHCQCKN